MTLEGFLKVLWTSTRVPESTSLEGASRAESRGGSVEGLERILL